MSQLTMGQRIAERRKLLGLSQEAFGEKMGVSRQAISKWEADAAVPEIDKLIAMSKLFGVTVGWLLGTETDAPEDGLSEEQLHLVEELIKKYGQRQDPPPAKRSVRTVVLAVLAGIVLLLAGNAFARAWQLQDRLSDQISLLHSRYNGITDQLSHLEYTINAVAQSERLAARYSIQLQAIENSTDLQLQFSAVPGAWQQGDTAWLSLRVEETEKLRTECSFDGNALSAQARIPVAESYDPYLIILHADGSQQHEYLRDTVLVWLPETTQFQLHWDCGGWMGSSDGVAMRDLHLSLHPPTLCPDNVQWEDIVLTVCVNGQAKQTFPLFPLGAPAQTQFQVTQPDSLLIEATADSLRLRVSELLIQEGDLVTIELQGSITSGHRFHQTLWSFCMAGGILQSDP